MARLNAVTVALPHLLTAPLNGKNTAFPFAYNRFNNLKADLFAALHARIPFWQIDGTVSNDATWNDGSNKQLILDCTIAGGPADINDTVYQDIPFPYPGSLPNSGIEPSEKYLAFPVRLVNPQFPVSFSGDAKLYIGGVLSTTFDLDVSMSVEATVTGEYSRQVGNIIYIGMTASIVVAVFGPITIPSLNWPDAASERGDVVSRLSVTTGQFFIEGELLGIEWPHGVTGATQNDAIQLYKPNDAAATTSAGFSRTTFAGLNITPLAALTYGFDPANPTEYTTLNPLYDSSTGAPIL